MIEVKQAKTLSELSGCLAGNPVEHPDHYAGDGKIECMDAMRSMMSGDTYALPAFAAHWWAEAFKYIWRWRRKGGVQDLRKCRQCIDYLIAEIEGEQ